MATALETLQLQLQANNEQLAVLRVQLSGMKFGDGKRKVKKMIDDLEDANRKLQRDIKRLGKSADKTEIYTTGYENGFNPIADKLNGIAGIVDAGGSAIANAAKGIGAGIFQGARGIGQGQADVINAQGMQEQGTSAASQNTIVIVILLALFLFKK